MNKVLKFALTAAAVALLGSTLTFADDAAPSAKPQVSIAAGKDLQAAQKALAAKRYDDVLTELDKVKSNSKKNDYDEYLMNLFYSTTYIAQKKYQQALPSLEASMASKYMPPADLKQRLVTATTLNYNLQNYDKTIEYGNRAIKEGNSSAQIEAVIAQSYYQKNDFRDAERFVHGMVDTQIKAGQTPSEELLLLGHDASMKLNNDKEAARWTELLVTYHPNPDYWQNLLQSLYGIRLTDRQTLQVYRLSADVGALKRGSDYAEMAQLSLVVGAPGEAVATLSKGFAANAFTQPADKNRNQHLLDSAKKEVAADQPTLAKTESDASNAATGDGLVGVGMAFFGNADYARAVKDIAAGLAKGVSKEAPDARLSLGIAQLKAGDKDAAVRTFRQVKDDPVDERLASLWVLRVKS
ncbi:MAG: tetratricopeptide repeat protein [Steroidobacteraceae bacterium]